MTTVTIPEQIMINEGRGC